MKIILSPLELVAVVANHYNIPAKGLTVEVAPDSEANKMIADSLNMAQYQAGNLDVNGNPCSDKKIAAIKLLRERIPNCGLGNAKHAVENWKVFLECVRQKGIPEMDHNHSPSWSIFKP